MGGGETTGESVASRLGLRILANDSNGDSWYGTGERFTVTRNHGDYATKITYEWCRRVPREFTR